MSAVQGSEAELLRRLRAGEEAAFRDLVRRQNGAMRRIALGYVQSPSIADEVVQETWLAVIRGLGRFEGRSSLCRWIFRILTNRAQSRGAREHRITPFSSLLGPEDDHEGTVDADRFIPAGSAFAGYWCVPPTRFFDLPEERLLADETTALIAAAIATLPSRQQQVIRMRDIEGWSAEEVCEGLDTSAANLRVLLHRARAAIRGALESHFSEVAYV